MSIADFVDWSYEQKLRIAIYKLIDLSNQKLNFQMYVLDYDERGIAEKLDRPVLWNVASMKGVIIDLHKLCVESINRDDLVESLTNMKEKVYVRASNLQLLQKWIAITFDVDANSILLPFCVLNDWRNILSHIDRKTSKSMASCYGRMGLDELISNHEDLYDRVLTGMIESYAILIKLLEDSNGTPKKHRDA